MVDLDVATWTAIGTWALVVGTLSLMYWQTRQAQELNSANSILALRERFDSPRMREARRRLSTHLLRGQGGDITSVEVATFFELIGTLTRRKVLTFELVWEAFGNWAELYYWALRHPEDLIGRTREQLHDPLVFHEFEWLYEHLRAYDRRMLASSHTRASAPDTEASPDDVLTILKLEAALDVQ